jgi:hypothetical protein
VHRRSTLVAVVVATAASTLIAACSGGSSPLPGSSAPSSASAGAGKGVAPDTIAASTPPTSSTPTSVAPTSTASTRASTPPPGLRDFGDVTFAVPTGFQQSSDYHPLTPLETDYVSHYLVPTTSTDTKEVIGLYVYALPAARTVTARTDPLTLIKAYNTKAKAVVRGTVRRASATIDGLPAYTETATEPGNYTYIAYWAFGTHHFLQFSCQLGSSSGVAKLAVACGTILGSLQLN